jgi:hypothetical protein
VPVLSCQTLATMWSANLGHRPVQSDRYTK